MPAYSRTLLEKNYWTELVMEFARIIRRLQSATELQPKPSYACLNWIWTMGSFSEHLCVSVSLWWGKAPCSPQRHRDTEMHRKDFQLSTKSSGPFPQLSDRISAPF